MHSKKVQASIEKGMENFGQKRSGRQPFKLFKKNREKAIKNGKIIRHFCQPFSKNGQKANKNDEQLNNYQSEYSDKISFNKRNNISKLF